MQILLVFAMYLGAAFVQVETLPNSKECMTAGMELSEMLREHKHFKEVQWQCIATKEIGKPT